MAYLDLVKSSEWFDRYHFHPSLCGCDSRNIAWMCRQEKRIRKILTDRKLQYQTWICIALESWEYDSIFVHTPNPQSAYPADLPKDQTAITTFAHLEIIKQLETAGYTAYKQQNEDAIIALIKST